jgi:hypothetical protein
VSGVAKWSGGAWSALGSGVNGGVFALLTDGSGNLYVGGDFLSAGGVPHTGCIAKWNGAAWSAVGSGTRTAGGVLALAIDGAGSVYAAGTCTMTSSATAVNKWNGSAWSTMGAVLPGWQVSALAVDGSNNLYAAGTFTIRTSPSNISNFAKWNGSAWAAVPGNPGNIVAMTASGTNLYVGGRFSMAGTEVANNIAKWDGSTWSPFGSGVNKDVKALALDHAANLYAGGAFDVAGTDTASPLIVQASLIAPPRPNIAVTVDTGHAVIDGVTREYFGTVDVGSSSTPRTYTITNSGDADLTSLAITGATAEFAVSELSATTVPAGGTATFTVTFSPGSLDRITTTLHIASNVQGPKNPFDILLFGGNGPPTLTLPDSPVTTEASSPAGAQISFEVRANDLEGGEVVPSLSVAGTPVASGSAFPIGETTVDVVATDSGGLMASGSFVVKVLPEDVPVVAAHADVGPIEATGPDGILVSYLPGSATDEGTPNPTITYSQNSDTIFQVGTTPVTISAADEAGHVGTAIFKVIVVDTTTPELTVPDDLTVAATGASGAIVNFSASATDAVTVNPAITYSNASGTLFPVGATVVTVKAKDLAGNETTKTFTVTVVTPKIAVKGGTLPRSWPAGTRWIWGPSQRASSSPRRSASTTRAPAISPGSMWRRRAWIRRCSPS